METGQKKGTRIYELDLFRGIAVLLMIFDHFMYDLGWLFPVLFSDYPRPGFSASPPSSTGGGMSALPSVTPSSSFFSR